MSETTALDLLERTLRTSAAIRAKSTDKNQQMTAETAVFLLRAVTEPFVWNTVSIQQTVIQRAEMLPPDACLAVDPAELMPEGVEVAWWCFDPPLTYAPEDVPPGASDRARYGYTHISAIAFTCTDGWPGGVLGGKAGYHVVVFRPMLESAGGYKSSVPGAMVIAPPGGTCSDSRLSPQGQAVLRLILAGCQYLKERVFVTHHEPVERHRRKQIARAISEGPMILGLRVVTLRHPEPTPHVPSDNHIDYQCQWDVKPHKRRQICKDGRTEVEVRSYRKGPKDKPLKVTIGTVYKVNR